MLQQTVGCIQRNLLHHLDNLAVSCMQDNAWAHIWTVTILPRAPQKTLQNDDATRAHDLKIRTCDIARDSHGMEDEIRAMVSSYMVPDDDDEDPELVIGRLVC